MLSKKRTLTQALLNDELRFVSLPTTTDDQWLICNPKYPIDPKPYNGKKLALPPRLIEMAQLEWVRC